MKLSNHKALSLFKISLQKQVTQVYITGFSDLIFQVQATSATFFRYILMIIAASDTSPSLDFPLTILAPASRVQQSSEHFSAFPLNQEIPMGTNLSTLYRDF